MGSEVLLKKAGKNQWQVQIGILKMNLPETDLQPAAPVKEPTQRIVNTIRSADSSPVVNQLDYEASGTKKPLNEVDQYLMRRFWQLSASDDRPRKRNRCAASRGLPII